MSLLKNSVALSALILSFALPASAAVIGVVDSGTDDRHPALSSQMWINAGEVAGDGQDNDGNTFADDVNGWNFAEGNNELIDRSFLEKPFSPEVYKFFAVQGRLLRGTATAEDKAWIEQIRQNQEVMTELQTFGNFMHGTHVSGITAKDVPTARVMGIKLLPTKQPGTIFLGAAKSMRSHLEAAGLSSRNTRDFNEIIVKFALTQLAGQQGKSLAPIGKYLASEGAQVTNCSFGVSHKAIRPMIEQLVASFIKDATPEQIDMFTAHFVTEVAKSMQTTFVSAAPNALFVIAAGNDGADNGVHGAAPANVRTDNAITVAATIDRAALASFSNYSSTLVDVAAPGVTISSAIPGAVQYLEVSGTSQASPYVARAAGMVLDMNPSLRPVDVRKVLMATVDAKPFLQGKVVSGGIVNPERAAAAANFSRSHSLDQAIALAKTQVLDLASELELDAWTIRDVNALIVPIPLTPLF